MKTLEIITLTDVETSSHTYILSINNNEVVAFDAGVGNIKFIEFIKEHNLQLRAVFLTHGHYDHISSIQSIPCEIPVYVNKADEVMLYDEDLNLAPLFAKECVIKRPIDTIKNGDVFSYGKVTIRCLETPFHTCGSTCYIVNNIMLFSGDTLFNMSIGRDDLPHALPNSKDSSLKSLYEIEEDLQVFPGHGQFTTLKIEKESNPFFKEFRK